jgi:hypothetical protein
VLVLGLLRLTARMRVPVGVGVAVPVVVRRVGVVLEGVLVLVLLVVMTAGELAWLGGTPRRPLPWAEVVVVVGLDRSRLVRPLRGMRGVWRARMRSRFCLP